MSVTDSRTAESWEQAVAMEPESRLDLAPMDITLSLDVMYQGFESGFDPATGLPVDYEPPWSDEDDVVQGRIDTEATGGWPPDPESWFDNDFAMRLPWPTSVTPAHGSRLSGRLPTRPPVTSRRSSLLLAWSPVPVTAEFTDSPGAELCCDPPGGAVHAGAASAAGARFAIAADASDLHRVIHEYSEGALRRVPRKP